MADPLPHANDVSALAANLLCVGRCSRPEVITSATQLANVRTPAAADARHANDTLDTFTHNPLTLHFPRLTHNPLIGHFPRLCRASMQLAVYADYSGSALSSVAQRKIGYMAALKDDTLRFSLLNWASHKLSRVCRRSTAGELLALAEAIAAALDIRQLLEELLD